MARLSPIGIRENPSDPCVCVVICECVNAVRFAHSMYVLAVCCSDVCWEVVGYKCL